MRETMENRCLSTCIEASGEHALYCVASVLTSKVGSTNWSYIPLPESTGSVMLHYSILGIDAIIFIKKPMDTALGISWQREDKSAGTFFNSKQGSNIGNITIWVAPDEKRWDDVLDADPWLGRGCDFDRR